MSLVAVARRSLRRIFPNHETLSLSLSTSGTGTGEAGEGPLLDHRAQLGVHVPGRDVCAEEAPWVPQEDEPLESVSLARSLLHGELGKCFVRDPGNVGAAPESTSLRPVRVPQCSASVQWRWRWSSGNDGLVELRGPVPEATTQSDAGRISAPGPPLAGPSSATAPPPPPSAGKCSWHEHGLRPPPPRVLELREFIALRGK